MLLYFCRASQQKLQILREQRAGREFVGQARLTIDMVPDAQQIQVISLQEA